MSNPDIEPGMDFSESELASTIKAVQEILPVIGPVKRIEALERRVVALEEQIASLVQVANKESERCCSAR